MTEPPVIRTWDDLIEALRHRKDALRLSNQWADDVGGLTRGHTDKILGPTRAKNLSEMTFDLFLEIFAVELVLQPNIEAAKRMEVRWEQRRKNVSQFRPKPPRVSKYILERAKPFVIKDFAKAGAAARLCKHASTLALQNRRGGKGRMRKMTRQQRSEFGRKAAQARWSKRDATNPVL